MQLNVNTSYYSAQTNTLNLKKYIQDDAEKCNQTLDEWYRESVPVIDSDPGIPTQAAIGKNFLSEHKVEGQEEVAESFKKYGLTDERSVNTAVLAVIGNASGYLGMLGAHNNLMALFGSGDSGMQPMNLVVSKISITQNGQPVQFQVLSSQDATQGFLLR